MHRYEIQCTPIEIVCDLQNYVFWLGRVVSAVWRASFGFLKTVDFTLVRVFNYCAEVAEHLLDAAFA